MCGKLFYENRYDEVDKILSEVTLESKEEFLIYWIRTTYPARKRLKKLL